MEYIYIYCIYKNLSTVVLKCKQNFHGNNTCDTIFNLKLVNSVVVSMALSHPIRFESQNDTFI